MQTCSTLPATDFPSVPLGVEPATVRCPAPAREPDGRAMAQLRFADGRKRQGFQRQACGPPLDGGLRLLADQLRHHAGVRQHIHGHLPVQPKDGGSRPGSRAGNCRSTPLSGPKCERMMLTRFREPGFRATASRRIRRASSSLDLPRSAARTRRRIFTSSSKLRIVMLAMSLRSIPFRAIGYPSNAQSCCRREGARSTRVTWRPAGLRSCRAPQPGTDPRVTNVKLALGTCCCLRQGRACISSRRRVSSSGCGASGDRCP